MATFIAKYQPTSQKTLFHKTQVSEIKDWLSQKTPQKLLLLSGPSGCGKSITLSILLKQFNIHNVDASDLRSSEKSLDISKSVKNTNSITLIDIEKWNHKTRKDHPNIVLVDNIELCDKQISTFLDNVFKKCNAQTPIILVCNNPKLVDVCADYSKILTVVSMQTPTLLELSKLSSTISSNESLSLSPTQITSIVKKCESDVRQLLHILEQYKLSNCDFQTFLDSISPKLVDYDLNQRMQIITTTHDFDTRFEHCSAEPLGIYLTLFQNYPQMLKTNTAHNARVDHATLTDTFSNANVLYTKIYEDQHWELYDDFTVAAAVIPSTLLTRSQQRTNETDGSLTFTTFTPFRDMSYNFINSYNDVIKTTTANSASFATKMHTNAPSSIHNMPTDQKYYLAKLFIQHLQSVFTYFNQHKKGKNTSKEEKIYLCDNISDPSVQLALDQITLKILHYGLFEANVNDLMTNKSVYLAAPHAHYNLIDTRMFKRFLNIFSINNSASKYIKPHVDTAIRYKLLQHILHNIVTPKVTDVESMIVDLATIWKL